MANTQQESESFAYTRKAETEGLSNYTLSIGICSPKTGELKQIVALKSDALNTMDCLISRQCLLELACSANSIEQKTITLTWACGGGSWDHIFTIVDKIADGKFLVVLGNSAYEEVVDHKRGISLCVIDSGDLGALEP
jgi:hypothetical protein